MAVSFNYATGFLKPRLFQSTHKSRKERRTCFDALAFGNGRCGGASTPEGGDMHQVFLFEGRNPKYNLHSSQPEAEEPHRFTMTISRYSLGTTIVLSSAVFMRPMSSYRSFSSRICCGTSSAENALSVGP